MDCPHVTASNFIFFDPKAPISKAKKKAVEQKLEKLNHDETLSSSNAIFKCFGEFCECVTGFLWPDLGGFECNLVTLIKCLQRGFGDVYSSLFYPHW